MIAAVHPCSFVDFPGRLAAVLFTQGCDLACGYCHNPELRPKRAGAFGVDAALEFLASRRGLLTGAVLCGGEPTLHAGLGGLLLSIRELGLAAKLDTNGMRPEVVRALVSEGLVDFVAVDVKVAPGRSSLDLCGADGQAESALAALSVAVESGVPHEARTTVVEGIHDEGSLETIAVALASRGVKSWRLQPVEDRNIADSRSVWAAPSADVMKRAVMFAKRLGLDAAARS